MFGSGPSEEIRLESTMASKEQPIDEQASQARYDEQLDHKASTAEPQAALIERLKRWFAARF
jgi:hypothetical protein